MRSCILAIILIKTVSGESVSSRDEVVSGCLGGWVEFTWNPTVKYSLECTVDTPKQDIKSTMNDQWEVVTEYALYYNTKETSLKMMVRPIQNEDFGLYCCSSCFNLKHDEAVCHEDSQTTKSITDWNPNEVNFLCKENKDTCNTTKDLRGQDQGVYWWGYESPDGYRVSRQKVLFQGESWKVLTIAISVCGVAVLLGFAAFCIIKRRKYCKSTEQENPESHHHDNIRELPKTPDQGTAIKTIYATSTFPAGDSAEPRSIDATNTTPTTPTTTVDTGNTAVYFTVNHPNSENTENIPSRVIKTTPSDGDSAEGVTYTAIKPTKGPH